MNPLEIKKPCGENWDNMRLGLISRHCGKCDKEVVDFTQMSKPEIFQYLYDNRDKKTCARIYAWQVDYTYEDVELTIKKLRPAQRKSNYYFYLLALGAFALGSCNYENKPINTEIVENINLGEMGPVTDTAIKKKDSVIKEVKIGDRVENNRNGKGMVIAKTARTITVQFENGNKVKNSYRYSDDYFWETDF